MMSVRHAAARGGPWACETPCTSQQRHSYSYLLVFKILIHLAIYLLLFRITIIIYFISIRIQDYYYSLLCLVMCYLWLLWTSSSGLQAAPAATGAERLRIRRPGPLALRTEEQSQDRVQEAHIAVDWTSSLQPQPFKKSSFKKLILQMFRFSGKEWNDRNKALNNWLLLIQNLKASLKKKTSYLMIWDCSFSQDLPRVAEGLHGPRTLQQVHVQSATQK